MFLVVSFYKFKRLVNPALEKAGTNPFLADTDDETPYLPHDSPSDHLTQKANS
jgi:hypothetical protein